MRAAREAGIPLRHYRCDRCGQFHLTSRTKGKRIPRPDPLETLNEGDCVGPPML